MLRPARIKARDRWNAAAHEAGHITIARHHGVMAWGWLIETESYSLDACLSETRAYVVKAMIGLIGLPLKKKREIAVAGAVGKLIASGDFFDELLSDLFFLHEEMSDTDCGIAGWPNYNEDSSFAAFSPDFQRAVKKVDALLSDKLRSEFFAEIHSLKKT